MKVGEIAAGKVCCILIDCDKATLYYPFPGKEDDPESLCNSMALEFVDEDETNAIAEATAIVGCIDREVEVAYA